MRSHSELFRDELGESLEHLRQAASHAPGGAAEVLTPPYDRARGMASRRWQQGTAIIIPLYETMKDGTRNARGLAESRLSHKDERSVLPTLLGLLATGIAIGALAGMVMRRRRAAQEWDEFEPGGELDENAEEARARMAAATKKVAAAGASVADNVSDRAGKLADSLREKAGTSYPSFADDNETAEDLIARSGGQE